MIWKRSPTGMHYAYLTANNIRKYQKKNPFYYNKDASQTVPVDGSKPAVGGLFIFAVHIKACSVHGLYDFVKGDLPGLGKKIGKVHGT